MGRNSWIMFGMVAVVIISLLLVALLILVPQSRPVSDGVTKEYEGITESEYSYTQSKDISEEAMKEIYSITTEDINEGKASKQYKQGNVNPFAAQASTNQSGSSANGNNTNGGNGNNNVTPYSADDK